MADQIRITDNAAEVLRVFQGLPERVRKGVKAGLMRGLLLVEDRVRRKTKVKARHGGAGLMGRLSSRVLSTAGDVSVDGVIGFRKTRGFPYELAQEYGASAKPGKAMAIPLTPEARRYSSPRQFPRKLFIPGGEGRQAVKTYTGRMIGILAESTARGLLRPQYMLLKSIPPRLGFRKTVSASGKLVSAEILRGMREAMTP